MDPLILYHRDNVFILSSGEQRINFKMKLSVKNKIIVPYPHFPFDPYSQKRIYCQSFNPRWRSLNSLFDFLHDVNQFSRLDKDEILWFDTGFWTIVCDREPDLFGLDLDSLNRTLQLVPNGQLALCLANRDTTIIFRTKFLKNRFTYGRLQIYVTNSYLPFVEVIQPFRDALGSELLSNNSTKERFFDIDNIKRIHRNPHSLFFKPNAIVRSFKHQTPMIAISKNPFINHKAVETHSLPYFFGQMCGGFREEELKNKTYVSSTLRIWNFQNTLVANLLYHSS